MVKSMTASLFSEVPTLSDENIVLRRLNIHDAEALRELVDNPHVYRYLPVFLFEQKYADTRVVISRLYDECLKDSLILGVFKYGEFCGLAEMYGYRSEIHKVSVGYRLLERKWGQGIAANVLKLMVEYLLNETDIEIITASTMCANAASARVLQKNGFELVVSGALEDWGYEEPVLTDKWIR